LQWSRLPSPAILLYREKHLQSEIQTLLLDPIKFVHSAVPLEHSLKP
jgi:hypothetical protein